MVALRWNDLGLRAASALLLAPLALAGIWVGAGVWLAVIACAAFGLAWEWVHLCRQRTRDLPGLAVPLAVLTAGAAIAFGSLTGGLSILVIGCILTWARARAGLSSGQALQLAAGVAYVGLAVLALILLRDDGDAGRANVLFLILIVWASDSGAYLAGRVFGGPRLAPLISPGKTWSGALGGLLAAVVVGMLAAHMLQAGRPLHAALLAAALSLIAQAGDLLESWLKRRFGVKDSGRLIPGHGGLFDRLDGVLTAAPAAAALALLLGHGVVLWG